MGQSQRARTFNTDVQNRLSGSPDLAHFNDVEGASWRAVFDEITKTPHRMWGDGIDIGATDTADQVSNAILNLVDRHPDLFGVSDSEFDIKSTRYNQRLDTWYVDIDQFIEGYPIYRSGITARI